MPRRLLRCECLEQFQPALWCGHDVQGGGVLIGYLRTDPANDQATAADRQALAAEGCEQIVEEMRGDVSDCTQVELQKLLQRLGPGDVLAVPQLRSLGDNLAAVVGHVQTLTSAGAGLRSLDEACDALSFSFGPHTGAASGGANLSDAAVRRSGAGGRPPKLSPTAQAEVVRAVQSGDTKAAVLARRYKVSTATISRVLARSRVEGWASAPNGSTAGIETVAEQVVGVLPPSALDTRLAIVGTSGSGKTYAAKGLLERVMAGGGRVCVVDPLGVWWGLAKGADGAEPPFPVAVFGGARADVPLQAGSGAALGRLIGREAMACVVDVSDFGSGAARRAFMTEFTAALHEANTEPLHLVLDEADLWAPQRTQPDGLELLGRMEEIVRRGRVRGFVPWLITQRPAVLHKDVLSQADVLVSMKLTSSQDRAAIGRWIEGQADRAEGRRILGALPQLRRGEGWVWAPGEGVLAPVSFPRIRTLDSSQTPRRDALPGSPRALAAVDPSAVARALIEAGVETPG